MRAVGCIVNDIVDREFDAKVERTKLRPIASGEISIAHALVFMALLLIIGLLVLIQLPLFAVFIGLAAVPLFILYPFMKRITYWPQMFLGVTFNIGILIGYATIAHDVHLPAVLLYLGGICWTLGYDTIYAHQDKADDLKIGVKSTALRFGEKSKPVIAVFYVLFMSLLYLVINMQYGLHLMSFTLFGLAVLHFTWQVWRLDINNPGNCMGLFRSNIYVGFIVVLALLLSAAGV